MLWAVVATCVACRETGSPTDSEPTPQPKISFVEGILSTRGATTCGVTTSGDLYCWGANEHGQTGTGSTQGALLVPTLVAGGHHFRSVTGGRDHTCGMASDGTWCWGGNSRGALGIGIYDYESKPYLTPVKVNASSSFKSIDANGFFGNENLVCIDSSLACSSQSCALSQDGEAFCWGDSWFISSATPQSINGTKRFSVLSSGIGYASGIDASQMAYCWGQTQTDTSGTPRGGGSPKLLSDNLKFQSVSAGYGHTCLIALEGAAYCTGSNLNGELGAQSDSVCRGNPCSAHLLPVQGGHKFQQIAVSVASPSLAFPPYGHTCGLTTDGDVYCWGWGTSGQLGNGSTVSSTTPVQITSSLKFVTIAVGELQSCAVAVDGDAYCWGKNGAGRLGNGTTTSSLVPAKVIMPQGVKFTVPQNSP